jgi:hypothetical protein
MPIRTSVVGRLFASAIVASALLLSLGGASAQEATPTGPAIVDDPTTRAFPTAIHTGTCDSPGEKVFDLSIIGIPEGGEIVGEPAIPAYLGVTEIPDVTIDDIANGEHIFVIFQATSDEAEQAGDGPEQQIVSCGLVGGTRFGGSLLFSVPPVGDPLYGAVVEMSEGDGAVIVTAYLTISLLGDNPGQLAVATPASSS